jgi:hypothetical protein
MEKIDLIVDLSSIMVNEQGNYEILVEPSAKQKFIIGSIITVGNQYENWLGVILEKKFIEQGLYLIIKQRY